MSSSEHTGTTFICDGCGEKAVCSDHKYMYKWLHFSYSTYYAVQSVDSNSFDLCKKCKQPFIELIEKIKEFKLIEKIKELKNE